MQLIYSTNIHRINHRALECLLFPCRADNSTGKYAEIVKRINTTTKKVIESKRGERFMNFIAMCLSLFNIILTRLYIYIVILHKYYHRKKGRWKKERNENIVVVILRYLNHGKSFAKKRKRK